MDLFETTVPPTALAASDTQLFVAENMTGARPNDTFARVVVAPTSGGTPALVTGSETPRGAGILGLAIHDGALYVSVAAERLAQSGVYRIASGAAEPVAGGPGSPTDLDRGNGDGGPALSAALQGPRSIALTRSGDLFIAEAGDSRVRLVRAGRISTYAGGNGCPSGLTVPGPGNARTVALCGVALLAVAPDGALYVAPHRAGHWIARIAPGGAFTAIATGFPVSGLAIDATGDLIAADSGLGRLLRYTRGQLSARPTVVARDLGDVAALAAGADGSLYYAAGRAPSAGQALTWKITRLVLSP